MKLFLSNLRTTRAAIEPSSDHRSALRAALQRRAGAVRRAEDVEVWSMRAYGATFAAVCTLTVVLVGAASGPPVRAGAVPEMPSVESVAKEWGLPTGAGRGVQIARAIPYRPDLFDMSKARVEFQPRDGSEFLR